MTLPHAYDPTLPVNATNLQDALAALRTGLISPLVAAVVAGGLFANSTLTLESTTGAGSTDYIAFRTASQVERMRIGHSGFVAIGGTVPFFTVGQGVFSALDVYQSTDANLYGNGTEGSGSVFDVGFYPSGTSPGVNVYAAITSYNNDGYADGWQSGYARGVFGAEILPLNNDTLGFFDFRAYVSGSGSNASFGRSASVRGNVDGTQTATSSPGRVSLWTCAAGNTNYSERMRIDSQGLTTFGGFPNVLVEATPVHVQSVVNSLNGFYNFAGVNYGNSPGGGGFVFAKTRGGSPTVQSAVQSGDFLADFEAAGSDGTTFRSSVVIFGRADATFTSGSSPGRWEFWTAPSGSSSPTERMRIDSVGRTTFTTGANTTVVIGKDAGAPNYNIVSVNGVINDAGGGNFQGLIGGASGDNILYFCGPQMTFLTTGGGEIERMRIDSNGTVNIGSNGAAIGTIFGDIPALQVSTLQQNIDLRRYVNAVYGPYIAFTKSRGATIGSNVTVQNGDVLGQIFFCGYDSSGTPVNRDGGNIACFVDGAPFVGGIPTRLVFGTGGASGDQERMRIDSTGRLFLGRDNNALGVIPNGGNLNPSMVIAGLSYGGSEIVMANLQAGANDANFVFLKSRAGTIQSAAGAAVVANDGVMDMNFSASDGTNWIGSAFHQVAIDGAVAANSVPMRFVWFTGVTGGGTERMRLDSAGSVNIGNAGPILPAIFGSAPQFQVSANASPGGASIALNRYSNDGNAQWISFVKSRGASIGTKATVNINDNIAYIDAGGYDATAVTPVLQESAFISIDVDLAPTAGSTPGRIRFATSSSGSSSPTERLRINNAGSVMMSMIALATTATDGFFYMNSCAGAPTGAPTGAPGAAAAMVIDTTNSKIWVRIGGTWKGVVVA